MFSVFGNEWNGHSEVVVIHTDDDCTAHVKQMHMMKNISKFFSFPCSHPNIAQRLRYQKLYSKYKLIHWEIPRPRVLLCFEKEAIMVGLLIPIHLFPTLHHHIPHGRITDSSTHFICFASWNIFFHSALQRTSRLAEVAEGGWLKEWSNFFLKEGHKNGRIKSSAAPQRLTVQSSC